MPKKQIPLGVSAFLLAGRTRTVGESLAQPPCAAGGRCSRAAGCAAVDHRRSPCGQGEGRAPEKALVFASAFSYPSRRLGISSPHKARCISSALRAVCHHVSACIYLRLDEIQHCVLMIYRNKLRMIYNSCAVDLSPPIIFIPPFPKSWPWALRPYFSLPACLP